MRLPRRNSGIHKVRKRLRPLPRTRGTSNINGCLVIYPINANAIALSSGNDTSDLSSMLAALTGLQQRIAVFVYIITVRSIVDVEWVDVWILRTDSGVDNATQGLIRWRIDAFHQLSTNLRRSPIMSWVNYIIQAHRLP